ncbi:MAG: cation:proton antiporter [Candidatus Izemoplasma sp.]
MDYILFFSSIFLLSFLLGEIFNKYLKLPKLLGYMIVGIAIKNFFSFDDFLTTEIVDFITSFALSVILLKAGLGIEKAVIDKIGYRVILLGTIPNLLEGLIVAALSYYLLDFELFTALMFGFIISAVSPAVVIPSMAKLLDEGYEKEIPTLSLASTSLDDVVSLTIFSIFLSLYLGESTTMLSIISIPLKFMIGIAFGGFIGYFLGMYMTSSKNRYIRILQFGLILLIALSFKTYGEYIFIIEMIAIMSLGYYFNDYFQKDDNYIKKYTNQVWKFAQVFLFFTIGFLTDLSTTLDYAMIGMLIIGIGLMFRGIGVLISLYKSGYSNNQKKFTIIANIPKATVQAALGAVPLASGVIDGEIILSISALAILITAPLGLIMIEIFSKKLLTKH